MKKYKTIFGWLLSIMTSFAITGATLFSAIPVAAAGQDWPLQLVGASTVNVSRVDLETLAAAHPSNTYVDGSGNTWKGVALWRLIAQVDDGDPASFNNALTGAYSIKLTAADGYSKTINPSDYAANFAFANSDDVFVANKVMLNGTAVWVDLPLVNPTNPAKLWYPLMGTGSGITVSGMRVGAIIKLELLNLPAAPVITATAGANGTITPAGAVNVNYGGSQTFNIAASSGYTVADVLVDGVSAGAVTTYTFNNVTASHTISAAFNAAQPLWTLELTGSTSTTLTDTTFQALVPDPAPTFTDNNGYNWRGVPFWKVLAQMDGSNGTFNAPLADTYTVKITDIADGTNTYTSASLPFSVSGAANSNVFLANWFSDGIYSGPLPQFNVNGSGKPWAPLRIMGSVDGTLATKLGGAQTWGGVVKMELQYTVTPGAGTGGTIAPSTAQTVTFNTPTIFTITPQTGYAIQDVLVDGVSAGAVSAYTFSGVNSTTAIHTIEATFTSSTPANYEINATAGANGTISPGGIVTVTAGQNQTFTITPNTAYKVADVLVDGVSAGAVTTYTFNNVTASHSISATFTSNQDWPLQLVGASTVNVSRVDLETLAAAHPSNTYVDGSGNTWKGVALWRLIAQVDDGDPASFNNALTGVYSIKLTAADGYSKTINPSDYAANFAFVNSEDVFIANKVMLNGTAVWVDLPLVNPTNPAKLWYPLMGTGSGITVSGMRVGAIIKLELLNLPAAPVITATAGANGTITPAGAVNVNYGGSQTFNIAASSGYTVADVLVDGVSAGAVTTYTFNNVTASHTISAAFTQNMAAVIVSAVPVSTGVKSGQTFDVNIAIDTASATRGWQTDINFDASKLTANAITEGGFLKAWALANGDATIAGSTPVIDNATGLISNISYAVTGTANTGGPSGSGTLCTISFTAKTGVIGMASITPAAVIVSDVNGTTIPGINTAGGSVAISSPFTRMLNTGWNLISTPVTLDDTVNTLDKILDMNYLLVAYRWHEGSWIQVTTATPYEIKPLEAFYVRMSGATSANFFAAGEITSPPVRLLKQGLNLIGVAPPYENGAFKAMPVNQALISIEKIPSGQRGYTMVISPSHNQVGWVYTAGAAEIPTGVPYTGLWVFMENEDSLAGFSTTPLP